jgi:hypothetical protein
MHKITINLLDGDEVKAHVVNLPENESELTAEMLFKVLDRLKDVSEDNYEIEYAAAWLDLSPAILRTYCADIYEDVLKVTAWSFDYFTKLDRIKEPELIELCGRKISTSDAYQNLTLGALEYMRAQTDYKNAFKTMHTCLRYQHEDATGRYITAQPEAQAISELKQLEAGKAYALLNFFFRRLKKHSNAGPITRLTSALTRWLIRRTVSRNTARLT